MIDLKKFKKPGIYKDKNLFINVLWYLINNLFFNSFIPGSKLRIIILNLFGADISKSAYIKPRVYIKFPWKLKIGKYSWIGEKVWIDNIDHVEIGNNCCISQGVYFCTGNHDFKKETFDLIVTSPPYDLIREKEYGNMHGSEYLNWITSFGREFHRVLKQTGSLVMDFGSSWTPGHATKSLYEYRILIKFHKNYQHIKNMLHKIFKDYFLRNFFKNKNFCK